MSPISLVALLTTTAAGSAGTQPATQPVSAALEVTYLANEGFLLRSGDDAVIIDGFVARPYSVYAAVPAAVQEKMLAGQGVFAGVDLALVSHPHRDHVQPDFAARFLKAHPHCQLVTSPQVVGQVREAGGDLAPEQLRDVLPENGETVEIERGGIRVEFLRIRHGSRRNYHLHNLGHIIHVGGKSILHIGDAEMLHDHYAPYQLAERRIDVALIPYWFYGSESGREIIERHLRGRHSVAVHVPPSETSEVKRSLAASDPDVMVFTEPLETRRF